VDFKFLAHWQKLAAISRAFINLINFRAESQYEVKIFTDGSRIVCEEHGDKIGSAI